MLLFGRMVCQYTPDPSMGVVQEALIHVAGHSGSYTDLKAPQH
jgi:hypothetical protein